MEDFKSRSTAALQIISPFTSKSLFLFSSAVLFVSCFQPCCRRFRSTFLANETINPFLYSFLVRQKNVHTCKSLLQSSVVEEHVCPTTCIVSAATKHGNLTVSSYRTPWIICVWCYQQQSLIDIRLERRRGNDVYLSLCTNSSTAVWPRGPTHRRVC